MGRNLSQLRLHSGIAQKILQLNAVRVLARQSKENRFRSQTGDIHRDIGRAARTLVAMAGVDDGDRSFRRDALDVAPDVAVEHNVANHEDPRIAPVVFDEADYLMQVLDQRGFPLGKRAE